MKLMQGLVALCFGAALVVGVSNAARAQDKKEEEKKPSPKPAEIKPKEAPPTEGDAGSAEMEMMKAMMEAGSPGPHHEHLQYFVGTWKTTVKAFMGPESSISEGTAVFAPMLGGRFIKETFTGDFGGMPFEGFGLMGYDNVQKKHIGIWCDSMGTGIAVTEGECDPSGKVFTGTITHHDPMTGKEKKSKELTKIIDENTFTFTMSGIGPDGKEQTEMEITYKRM